MNTALRLVTAILFALAIAACTPKAIPEDVEQPVEKPTAPPVETRAAPDPHDYTDDRNWIDNGNGSPLSQHVIYFDYDKSTVRAEYREVVAAHAAYLAAHSNQSLTLEGHADERGTREYNLGLGERRGNSVMGLMSAQGARGNQSVVVSYGEERPNCRVSEEVCWSKNRRVEITKSQ